MGPDSYDHRDIDGEQSQGLLNQASHKADSHTNDQPQQHDHIQDIHEVLPPSKEYSTFQSKGKKTSLLREGLRPDRRSQTG